MKTAANSLVMFTEVGFIVRRGRSCTPRIESTSTSFEIIGDYIVPKIKINEEEYSVLLNLTHASMDYEILPVVMYSRDKKAEIE